MNPGENRFRNRRLADMIPLPRSITTEDAMPVDRRKVTPLSALKIVTVAELAARSGESVRTLNHRIRVGVIPVIEVGAGSKRVSYLIRKRDAKRVCEAKRA
jgi:hypothetical protein